MALIWREGRPLAMLMALACVLPGGIRAQGGPSTLQFSFSNPGARSLAMGGAFTALADDATAAFANPSGLTQLTRSEISIEGRYWSYSTPFTLGGRVSGEPTGIGFDGPLRTGESEFDTSAISFLSFVYPGRRWTAALSRHQSARFEVVSATQGLFTDVTVDDPQPTCLAEASVCRYPDFSRSVDLDVVTTTVSLAFRVFESLSLGVGLSYWEADIFIINDQFTVEAETLPAGFFGPNAYLPAARIGGARIAFDDSNWQPSFGLLWSLHQQWSLGAVYRPGAEFEGAGAVVSGAALDPPVPEGSIAVSDPALPLATPDVWGVGLAYRSAGGAWTASLEWDRVQYSQILESVGRSPIVDVEEVVVDDADELRLGVEYAFLRWQPLMAVRAGAWRNPDHTIRTFEDDPLEQALLPAGEDEVHFSFGLGAVWKNLQIDLAFDASDLVDTASLSLIYQF